MYTVDCILLAFSLIIFIHGYKFMFEGPFRYKIPLAFTSFFFQWVVITSFDDVLGKREGRDHILIVFLNFMDNSCNIDVCFIFVKCFSS